MFFNLALYLANSELAFIVANLITPNIQSTLNKNKKLKSAKNISPDFQELIYGILTMRLICLFLQYDGNCTGNFRDRF